MTKAPELRVKEMHRIQSSSYFNRINKDKIDRIKCAEDIIQDLEHYGPAGLIHISILSNIIGKPIRIWNANGSLNRIIGKRKTGRPIDIEYHMINSEQTGHWTLKYGKDPDNISIDLNSCLFSVIGSQIGRNPSELRKWTVLNLKSNFRKLVNWMYEILRLEKNGEIILMIGGACYRGTSPRHAGIILDNSQNMPCHECLYPGHPRGHTWLPVVEDEDNIVEYSKGTTKTGFRTRDDQNYVTHLALKTKSAQDAMTDLNNGLTTTIVELDREQLQNRNSLPKAVKFRDGKLIAEGDFISLLLVLRHHEGQFSNPCADVFVHTCYPKMELTKKK